jgi:hypothetical protein
MTYGWTKWTALAVVLAGGLVVSSEADARHRHRRNRCCNTAYYNYGCNTGYNYAWNEGGFYNGGACCQTAFIQPAAACCGAWPSSAYGSHTTGYAPQGTYYGTNGTQTYDQSTAPPPPAEGNQQRAPNGQNRQNNSAPAPAEEAPPREATPPEAPQPDDSSEPNEANSGT